VLVQFKLKKILRLSRLERGLMMLKRWIGRCPRSLRE